jgi:hypothetical protein
MPCYNLAIALPWMDAIIALGKTDNQTDKGATERCFAAWNIPNTSPYPAWREVAPLIALHHAISYRYIRLKTEPCVHHEMGSDPSYLRKASVLA